MIPASHPLRQPPVAPGAWSPDQPCEELLATYAVSRDPRLRTCVIERHEHLARFLAGRFVRPGVPLEDLTQTARVALVGAAERFDPSHGTMFRTYASHCIVGEIKRYFRDHTWAVKAPRRLQEIATNLYRTQNRLYARLHREPTVGEMAVQLGTTETEILEAIELRSAYQPLCLDDAADMADGSAGSSLGDSLGRTDAGIENLIDNAPLHAAVRTLAPRDQRILGLRFAGELTQQQVGIRMGLSQMHVSRLERSALVRLRKVMRGLPAC